MVLYRNVFYVLGILFFVFAGLMFVPALVDLCSAQETGFCFVVSSLFCCFVGGLLFFSSKSNDDIVLNAREKTIIVLLSWVAFPVISALPVIISPLPISIIDCIFETTSSLTTTGATIIFDIKSLSDGFLLWRGILQTAGGICFIISCLHVFSHFRPSGALESDRSENASLLNQIKIITSVYLSLVFISSFLLVGSGLPAVDAFCYSFASVSSGGLISDNNYNLAKIADRTNWILAVLMFVSGVSITFIRNLIFSGISAFKDKQFICYVTIIGTSAVLLSMHIYTTSFSDLSLFDSLGQAFFVVTSSVTTTGISINNTSSFGSFVDSLLYVLNFCGGCSGSSTGGIKIFRWMILFLLLKSYLIRLIKTNAVHVLVYADKKLDEFDVTSMLSYFLCYLILAVFLSLALSFSDMEFAKAFGAVLTTMNNNGPFFGLYKAAPTDIAALSSFAKSVLITAMIAGRVEYITFFMVLVRPFWKK